MYTDAQIDNVFKSTGTSFRQNGKRNGGIRIFDVEVVDARTHTHVQTFKDNPSVEAGIIKAVEWLVSNRNGTTVATGTPRATESRVSQLEAELAKTNALLQSIQAAQAPAPAATSADGEPKRGGRRKKEPLPERAEDETTN